MVRLRELNPTLLGPEALQERVLEPPQLQRSVHHAKTRQRGASSRCVYVKELCERGTTGPLLISDEKCDCDAASLADAYFGKMLVLKICKVLG